MKILVDKMPTEPRECIFSNIATGKYRCRNNALLCPLARGEECKFLTDASPAPAVEPKKRPAKKSTSKNAE
jgi:hypothetical protein